MLTTKLDKLYFNAIIILSGQFIFLSQDIYSFRQYMHNLNKSRSEDDPIIIRGLSDILIVFAISGVIYFLRGMNKMLFEEKVDKQYKPLGYDNHDYKVDRFLHYQFSCVFYLLSLSTAFYIFYDHPNIYSQLNGGADTIYGPIKNWPYSENISPLPYLRAYFQINMSAHFHNLIYHMIFYTYIVNYIEMLLHHIITVFLFVYSYYTNQFAWAVVVLISHDMGDFWLSFAKWWRDLWEIYFEAPYQNQPQSESNGKNLSNKNDEVKKSAKKHPLRFNLNIVYICQCFFFVYGRVYQPLRTYIPLGFVLWNNGFIQAYGKPAEICYWGFVFLITCFNILWCLNVFWTYAIFAAGYEKIFGTGKFTDKHAGESEEKVKKSDELEIKHSKHQNHTEPVTELPKLVNQK